MVGVPLCTVQVTLEEVPEMKYSPFDEDPAGEVCLRGLTVFKGYGDEESAFFEEENRDKADTDDCKNFLLVWLITCWADI